MARGLFLPFTSAGKATELRAIEVKKELGLSAYASVDPYAALSKVPALLVPQAALDGCLEMTRQTLLVSNRDDWSAVCYGSVGPTGEALILLNPTHHSNRQRVSLMEEIVHVVLDHPPTELQFDRTKVWVRPYNDEVEAEAYGVGAACILPYRTLFNFVNFQRKNAAEIAELVGVSAAYVEYRIKQSGLYRIYKKNCA